MIDHQPRIQAVCTANITRSPVWAAVAQDYAFQEGREDIIVSSSGMRAANEHAHQIVMPGKEYVLKKFAGFVEDMDRVNPARQYIANQDRAQLEYFLGQFADGTAQDSPELNQIVDTALFKMGQVVNEQRSAWLKQNGIYLRGTVGTPTRADKTVDMYVTFGQRNEGELVDKLLGAGILDPDDIRGPEIQTVEIVDAWGRADPQAFAETYEAVRDSATEVMGEYLSR